MEFSKDDSKKQLSHATVPETRDSLGICWRGGALDEIVTSGKHAPDDIERLRSIRQALIEDPRLLHVRDRLTGGLL